MAVRFAIFFIALTALAAGSIVMLVRNAAPAYFASHASRAKLWRVVIASMAFVVMIEATARRFAPVGGGVFRYPVAVTRTFLFAALFTAPITFALYVLDRLITWLRHRFTTTPTRITTPATRPGEVVLTRRDAVLRAGALTLSGVSAGSMTFGGLRVARDLQVREIEVYIRDLPPTLEGLSIAQLTDLHVGIFTGHRDFDAVLDQTRRLRPDLVVLTGDLLDNNPAHVPDAMAMFSKLHAPLGRVAILGNHDYYAGYHEVLDGLRRAEITTLVNQGLTIQSGTRHPGLALLGVDDAMAWRTVPGRVPDLDRALRDVSPDAPRVLLAHNPILFRDYAGRVALQLSGHTHGGQINPGSMAELVLRYVSGRYESRDSVLFVSNGIGLTGPPVRLFAPPEIVRIGLTGRRRT